MLTHNFYRGQSYMEVDINIHKFSNMSKKGLEVMFNRFDQMMLSIGFCIESRDDSEMPEVLFGCGMFNKPCHYQADSVPAAMKAKSSHKYANAKSKSNRSSAKKQ
jgi:hypothetical protein